MDQKKYFHGILSRSTVLPLPTTSLSTPIFTLSTGTTNLIYYNQGVKYTVSVDKATALQGNPSTAQTSGNLVIGQYYIINTYAGGDFTNVGAASNAQYVVFQATGTTPAS